MASNGRGAKESTDPGASDAMTANTHQLPEGDAMDFLLSLTDFVLFLADLVTALPRAIAAGWRALRRAPRVLVRAFLYSIAGGER